MYTNEFLIILILAGFGWVTWWMFFRKNKRRRKHFSAAWRKILLEEVKFYRDLSVADRDTFEQMILHFLEKVTITGVETTIDDKDLLLVASSGVIPLFEFPSWEYCNLNEVLLYGSQFNQEYQTSGKERNILGMVGSGAMNRMMILSKPALHQGFKNHNSKMNVGIHEFIHLLDKSDGEIDGIPEVIMEQQYVIPWLKLMHEEINDIKAGKSDINPYGATNQAEFFSVVSEYFFKRPLLFQKKHPELFDLMEKVFRVE
jgi:hypothetical protein